MMHGYIKMGNVSYRIVSNISLFMCKIHVPVMLTACPYHRIHAASVHHSPKHLTNDYFKARSRLIQTNRSHDMNIAKIGYLLQNVCTT